MNTTQPNTTLYINNLNDKVNKEELRHQLFALFTTYGKVIDVVAQKGPKMRGQAFLVFGDLAGATAAMRACEGIVFYDKPIRIHYAKTKSYATLRREDPNFIPPAAAAVHNAGVAASEKRARDDDMNVDERASKKERADDEDGEEMEIEDDEDGSQSKQAVAPAVNLPSARLLCTNLPQEVTDDVLSVLFQQYQGFQSTRVVPAPEPNAAGQKVKMAQVLFDSPELSSVAKEALDGFTLKKGWVMSVAYV
ncbi:RNA-binding domain-containing protein [Neolentinus lepideus HHB14362 ss-1]|uniref:RNA-binding domain-containing protein n=1 Tax=Neolentinus lepideus HHB14362 ss-1 TaxID=1314782 RepID=A0A165V883_9AGAM|nr:RNA-binding domain-containing protein [Neolentinus lepideus HHB14362 ss-1]